MATVNEKLTNLADKIRILSGTEDKMGLDAMVTHVDEVNEDISTVANLIAQIETALEDKSSGDNSGMNIETCIVTIKYDGTDFGAASDANATIYSSVLDSNGNIQLVTLQSGVDFVFEEGIWGSCNATIVLENVVKNSLLGIVDNSNALQYHTDFDTIEKNSGGYVYILFINQDGNMTIN